MDSDKNGQEWGKMKKIEINNYLIYLIIVYIESNFNKDQIFFKFLRPVKLLK